MQVVLLKVILILLLLQKIVSDTANNVTINNSGEIYAEDISREYI